MTVEKGEHRSNSMWNDLGQTIPLVQQKITPRRQMDGIGRCVVIFNETLNNDVTVYRGYNFNFGIGNRTSTCILDLWFTYHYLSNGFLIFSTGS